ncbi:MAG: LysR family transcriptional regulator [Pseudomonadota bacterium]
MSRIDPFQLTEAQMRAFNAIARERSFSKGARLLGVSQPAVTQQVRKLEQAFEVVLFERRGSGGVDLTEIGQRLFRITQALDDINAMALGVLRRQRATTSGRLRIATASPQVFMPLLARFRARYPDVDLDVFVGGTHDALNKLIDREADIGLFPLAGNDPRLLSRPVVRQRLMALVPSGHKLASRASVSLPELVSHPMIFRTSASFTQTLADEALRDQRIAVHPALRLQSREAAIEAVANGIGVGFILSEDMTGDPRIKPVRLARVHKTVMEGVVCLKQRFELSPINDFFNFAVEQQGATTVKGGRHDV